MKNKIIVKNQFRVGNFIKTNLEYEEDLLLSKDTKVIDFLNKYSKYLNSCEEEDLLEFFKLTGLYIGHEYVETNEYKRIYFSINGPDSRDYEIDNINAYTNHLIIETHVENIEIFKNSILIDNKEIYIFKKKEVADVDGHKWNLALLDTKERIKYLKENNYIFPNNKKIKDILLDPLNNVLSLTDNGDLYINNYLYSKDVDYIFELNSRDIKFIYKNNIVEDYVESNRYLITKKYDKVLCNDNFLATLKNNMLCVYIYLELYYDKSVYMKFDMVTDIEYNKNHKELVIIKNKEQIHFPIDSVMILS